MCQGGEQGLDVIGKKIRQKKDERKVDPLIVDLVDDYSIFSRQSEKRIKFYNKNNYKITGQKKRQNIEKEILQSNECLI